MLVFWSSFSFVLAAVAAQFQIESHLARLQQFGPLKSSDWAARPMRLVADFTFQIDALNASAGQPFMFVSAIGPPYPPLGGLNWKSSKLGVGRNNTVLQGGGPGHYERDGLTTIVVRTGGHPTAPWTVDLSVSQGRAHLALTAARSLVRVGDVFDVVVDVRGPTAIDAGSVRLKLLDEFGAIVAPLAVDAAADACALTPVRDRVDCGGIEATCAAKGCCWAPLQHNSQDPWCFARTARRFVARVRAAKEGTLWLWIEDGGADFSGGSTSVQVTNGISSGSKWGPLIELRDNSDALAGADKPADGWFVTPIHSIYLPVQRALLISGFLRRDGVPCGGGTDAGPNGRRRSGITFRVAVDTVVNHKGGVLQVERVDDKGEFVFGKANGNFEGAPIDGDTIYCAGHTHLANDPAGRILFVGGARYGHISSQNEVEFGVDYARMYDPTKNAFEMCPDRMPLGRSWYPTAGMLSDGRVLVTGAFSDYATSACTADACLNPQINVFDPALFDAKQNPWSVWLDKKHGDPDLNPGVREYTRVFALPKRVRPKGASRDFGVLALGKAGHIVFIADDDDTPVTQRLFKPANGKRPGKCGEASNQSSAAPLTIKGGLLMIVGGCVGDDDTMQRIDLYSVENDTWTNVSTGVMRGVPSTILLPDGTVLILSGENERIDQNERFARDAPMDTRVPQVFDPETMTVRSEFGDGTQRDLFRGYHNVATLLPDGSVLVGGGFNQGGDVGCEEPNLRIFTPSYLTLGARPVIAKSAMTLVAGQKRVEIRYSGARVRSVNGVASLLPNAFTHSYDQNQRHVWFEIVDVSDDTVTVNVPELPLLMAGFQQLFLLSEQGVPSVAAVAFVKRRAGDPEPRLGDETAMPGMQPTNGASRELSGALTTAVAIAAAKNFFL